MRSRDRSNGNEHIAPHHRRQEILLHCKIAQLAATPSQFRLALAQIYEFVTALSVTSHLWPFSNGTAVRQVMFPGVRGGAHPGGKNRMPACIAGTR